MDVGDIGPAVFLPMGTRPAPLAITLELLMNFTRCSRKDVAGSGAIRAQSTMPNSLRALAFGACCLMAVAPLGAQGGGMGGGMGGGRSGGGAGGRGGGGMGQMKSPADMIRDNIQNDDPLKFLLDHRKPLSLTSPQRDSIEHYRDEMSDMQKPLFKTIDDEIKKMPGRSGSGGGMGGGGMGGGRGGMGGGRGGESGGRGAESGERGAMGAMPDTVRSLVNRLADIQQAYGDRARAQLTEPQRLKADSLHTEWLAEQRKREEAKRRDR